MNPLFSVEGDVFQTAEVAGIVLNEYDEQIEVYLRCVQEPVACYEADDAEALRVLFKLAVLNWRQAFNAPDKPGVEQ